MSIHAKIAGVGFCVPDRILTNQDLQKMVDTTDEWIRTRTGILERRIVDKGVGTSDLAGKAAERAMAAAGITADRIDLIICATSTPDTPLPSTACHVQARIGATRAAAFDLAAACAGYIYALVTAEQFIKTGTYKTILVIGADILSSMVDWTDRATCVLFGDGAGAAVLVAGDCGGILSSVLWADGTFANILTTVSGGSRDPITALNVASKSRYVRMSGAEVFKLAVRGMTDATERALTLAGVELAQVACFIPHQANLRIIDAVAARLKFPKEKIFVNLQKYGNTSAASIGIAFCEALQEGRIKKGDKVAMATFGSGLVCGALIMEW